ncbi:hypothetical protein IWZ01DRAFT_494781 [Phyllosticta capitalensis]
MASDPVCRPFVAALVLSPSLAVWLCGPRILSLADASQVFCFCSERGALVLFPEWSSGGRRTLFAASAAARAVRLPRCALLLVSHDAHMQKKENTAKEKQSHGASEQSSSSSQRCDQETKWAAGARAVRMKGGRDRVEKDCLSDVLEVSQLCKTG